METPKSPLLIFKDISAPNENVLQNNLNPTVCTPQNVREIFILAARILRVGIDPFSKIS